MAKWENVRVKAVYDYVARTANELSFKKGQSIFVFSADDDGWASGECMGRQGWFPSSYVTPETALNEIAHAQAEAEPAAGQGNKNVDRRSLLLQKQQTSTHLNEALMNRPDREHLESKHILAPSTSGGQPAAQPAAAAAAAGHAAAKPPAGALASSAGASAGGLSSSAGSGGVSAPAGKKDDKRDDKKKGIGGIFGFGKKKDTPLPAAQGTTYTISATPSSSGGGAPLGSSAGAAAPVVTTINSAPPASQGLRAARYFRVALTQLPDMKDGTRQLPSIVENCVEYIRKTALDMEGIFRISGLASEVDGLQKQFESGDYNGKLRSNDPHAIAGVLKKFFRELPEPLFTIEMHKPLLDTLKVDQGNQAAALKPLIDSLPPVNLRIIRYMIPFLFVVSRHKDRNMMNVQNLSIVFGPTFMRSAEENRTGVPDGTNRGAAVIENLILHCEAVFGPVEGADSSQPPAAPEARRVSSPVAPAAGTAAPPTITVAAPKGGSMRAPAPLVSPRPGSADEAARTASATNAPAPAGSRIQPGPPGAKPAGSVIISPPPAGIKPPSRAPAKAAAPPAAAAAPPAAPAPQKSVRALYDYKGDPAKGQLSFAGGEVIALISQHESGWWTGEIRGHKGYFPSTFVEHV